MKLDGVIDGELLFKAMDFFRGKYPLKKVPMCTDFDSVFRTLPKGVVPLLRLQGEESKTYYVGSAEQSFIQLYSKGIIDEGKYSAITPCQRDEVEDDIHYKIFLKLELIDIGNDSVDEMIKEVASFLLSERMLVKIVDTDIGKDLYLNGIEVGSYGTRTMPDGTLYTYGTGLALPRITQAKTKL